MSGEIWLECSMMAEAFALGVILRLVWDGLEVLRRLLPGGRIAAAAGDIIYWSASAVAIFRLLYRYTSGSIRGIVIVVALGGLLFMAAIDKKIRKKCQKLLKIRENTVIMNKSRRKEHRKERRKKQRGI